jgi:hypothetical protein
MLFARREPKWVVLASVAKLAGMGAIIRDHPFGFAGWGFGSAEGFFRARALELRSHARCRNASPNFEEFGSDVRLSFLVRATAAGGLLIEAAARNANVSSRRLATLLQGTLTLFMVTGARMVAEQKAEALERAHA